MEANVAEVLKESLLNGFVTMINTPIPIGNMSIPFWTILIFMFLIRILFIIFRKVRV